MVWFIPALVCIIAWGTADLFYKKSTNENDSFSQYKIAIWVGIVMGVGAFAMLPFAESIHDFGSFLKSAAMYSPASFSYIISMVIGYAGLRYLEVSIVSPVQNSSGAFSMIVMLIYLAVCGDGAGILEETSSLDFVGTAIISAGLIMLAIVENRTAAVSGEDRKFRFGAKALLFPILYCIFDTIGTAADGIILSEMPGGFITPIDVLILYGFTFFVVGIVLWIVLLIRTKRPYNPFNLRTEKHLLVAALCEEAGQVFYVLAMAFNPVLAAPMIAGYCIISVLLGRIFLREKLSKPQYACIFTVIAGILLLGISEGLAA